MSLISRVLFTPYRRRQCLYLRGADGHLSPWRAPRAASSPSRLLSTSSLGESPTARVAPCVRPIRRLQRGGLPFSLPPGSLPPGIVSVALTRRTARPCPRCRGSGTVEGRSPLPGFRRAPRSVLPGLSSGSHQRPSGDMPRFACQRAARIVMRERPGMCKWCRRRDLNPHALADTTP